MKVRAGFVSNSSSSSFIVSYDPKVGEPKLFCEIDLAKMGSTIKTVEELNAWVVDERGGRNGTLEDALAESKYFAGKYAEMKRAIERGEVVIAGDVYSDDRESIGSHIYNNGWPTPPDYIRFIQE